jgi:zinc transporter
MNSHTDVAKGAITEADGLICAFVLDGEGGGTRLDWEGVRAWKPDDGVLWVHVDRKDAYAADWIRRESGVGDVFAEGLLADDARPRVVPERNDLFVVMRGVNLNPGAHPEDMVSMRMWFEPGRIITSRHVRLMAATEIRDMVINGDGPGDPGEFLVRMADRLIERMGPTIDGIDESLDELEDAVQTHTSPELRSRLVRTRQSAIMLRRYLSPQRDAMSRLQAERITWLSDLDRAFLREIGDRTTRYVEDLEAARERAAAVQDEFNYLISERMNRTMYVLTVVAAILLPPSLLTGLLGINVGGLPGVEDNTAFWVVVGLIVGIAVVEIWLLRKLKWI